MEPLAFPVVYLVTDRRRVSTDARTLAQEVTALERVLDDAIEAGVDVVQIRESDLPAALLLALVQRICRAAYGTSTRVVVNDRIDVALAAGADGVHLPSHGVSVAVARTVMETRLVGCSTHSDTPARMTTRADYAVFGTVFETRSKPGRSDVAGLAGLSAAARKFPVPVIAIGGITPERAADCLRGGAAGVAAIAPFLPAGREPGAMGAAPAVVAFREAMRDVVRDGR